MILKVSFTGGAGIHGAVVIGEGEDAEPKSTRLAWVSLAFDGLPGWGSVGSGLLLLSICQKPWTFRGLGSLRRWMPFI